ncbi:uncharacterized protein LOC111266792 isoform X3 [Varroa jacobsoni]|uniref:uncharacterized protein LOC111266792 isoform X3 n=1 Tax=Varroa jacobsoni TaxID=62625 RepID=UPI000BF74AD6|nr:uncharacterized protein LOC111266792 isoform X3 [Varroa jacobsoni]
MLVYHVFKKWKEKLGDDLQVLKPTLAAESEDTLVKRVKARRKKSDATLVPEFTFTVSPEPTVVLSIDDEKTRGNSRMQLRTRGVREADCSDYATPTSKSNKQGARFPNENKVACIESELSQNPDSAKGDRGSGANKSILEDLTNNRSTAGKRSKRHKSKVSASAANYGEADEGTEVVFRGALHESGTANDNANAFQDCAELSNSNSLTTENIAENKNREENEMKVEVVKNMKPPKAEGAIFSPNVITDRHSQTSLPADNATSSEKQDESLNQSSNDVFLNQLAKCNVENTKVNNTCEQINPKAVDTYLKIQVTLGNPKSDSNRVASPVTEQTTEKTQEEHKSSQDLSFESREIRKKIQDRLEGNSSDDDSLCFGPANDHRSEAGTLFDTLLQERNGSLNQDKAVQPNKEIISLSADVAAKGQHGTKSETKTSDVQNKLSDQSQMPFVIVRRLPDIEAASDVGEAQIDGSAALEDNLIPRFGRLKKNSAEFKHPLPPHMAAHKRMSVNASPASFTSDEGAATSDLQIFAGAAVRQALTVLEDPSHETLTPRQSEEIIVPLPEECASREGSIDSDADIDVMMQSKFVGTSKSVSAFLEQSYGTTMMPTPALPSRHSVATSMTGHVRAPQQESVEDQENNTFELVLDDADAHVSSAKQNPSITSFEEPNSAKLKSPDSHAPNSDSYRGSSDFYMKTNEEKQLAQRADTNSATCKESMQQKQAASIVLTNQGTLMHESIVEVKQENCANVQCDTRRRYAFPISTNIYPEEEEDPDFVSDETEELRAPRKYKLESTRLPGGEAPSDIVFIISDDENKLTLQETDKVVIVDNCRVVNDKNFQLKQNSLHRNDMAVATGPSLFEKFGEALPQSFRLLINEKFDEKVSLRSEHNTQQQNILSGNSHIENSRCTPTGTMKGLTDLQNQIHVESGQTENVQLCAVKNGSSTLAEVEQHHMERDSSVQPHVNYDDGTHKNDAAAKTQGGVQRAGLDVHLTNASKHLVSDSIIDANSTTSLKILQSGRNFGDDVTSSGKSLMEEGLKVDSNRCRETFNVTSKSTPIDPFHLRGEKTLKDLISYGLVRMPFLGLNTTSHTVSTPSLQMCGDQECIGAIGASASGPACLLKKALNAQTPTSTYCLNRYRIAESKPHDGNLGNVFSPQLPVGEGGPLRRRYLFQEELDDIKDLLPDLGSPPPTVARRRLAKGFMLDSNRLPHFNESYVEVGYSGAELKICGEELFATAVKQVIESKPGISRCIRRALEKRILPDYEESLKEIMVLLVKKAALRDQITPFQEEHMRKQKRLEHARNFINATVEKLLPEGENDVIKVLGFNPYDGQMPPSESARKSTIRRLQETETHAPSRKKSKNSPINTTFTEHK